MTETASASSYDDAPYPRLSHYFTHPDKAAALATLLGLHPPPVEACRVLELGCARGDNLIPIAQALPHSQFLGLDLSGRQIAEGQADVATLGLTNISLRQFDLTLIDSGFGEFDYILAHGLYSWVPAAVRDRLLAVCRDHLAPDGVAFVSYNVYPGWHGLDAVRRMMLYHTRDAADPAERAAKARSLLEFLAGATDPNEYYGAMLNSHQRFLAEQAGGLGTTSDTYLLHDHLEEVNEPVYFHEFAAHAARYDLQYLCDAVFPTDFLTSFSPATGDALVKMSHNIVELEQYMDFVRNQMFRETLLVHADRPVSRRITADRLQPLWIGSPAVPESESPDVSGPVVEAFRGRDKSKLSIDHPLSKAAMVCLALRWPATIPFPALVNEAQALVEGTAAPGSPVPPPHVETLAANLLKAFTHSEGLVEFHSGAPRFTLEIGDRPRASPWARLQVLRGQTSVTNLRHERINLGPLLFHIVRLLDGTRDRAALLAALEKPVADGEIAAKQDGQVVTDFKQNMEILAASLDSKLRSLALAALLVAD
jgi:methyltransferase-like protein/2-polyprenyl-3-methyl-5-hydroxy-6-metoxy-1,4-benzoquinol methylase